MCSYVDGHLKINVNNCAQSVPMDRALRKVTMQQKLLQVAVFWRRNVFEESSYETKKDYDDIIKTNFRELYSSEVNSI
jgi:ribosomal protein S26